MALLATIVFVVVLVAFRLLGPPLPGLLQTSIRRWGSRTTAILCAISIACATLAIIVSRR